LPETIIGASFAKWVNSYRDLPLLINQWANVVRWELRTRLFLRTAEFLWQEGHTVHASKAEAEAETRLMLDVYAKFAQEYLAVPVVKGEKSEGERFPGAVATFSIEAMMQDKKALQAGTSHFLGQNFAKSSDIKYQNKDGEYEFAWTTSWGVSTRLIGALIMAHSDDNGLVLPPKIAPAHIAIIPIAKSDEDRLEILEYIKKITSALQEKRFDGKEIIVEVDDTDATSGEKNWKWIKRGMPIRLEIGKRDMEANSIFMGRRDLDPKEKKGLGWEDFVNSVDEILNDIQNNIYQKALDFRSENSAVIDDKDEFYNFFTPENKEKPEIHGGFAYAHWCGSVDCEEKIKEDLKVTIRNIPFEADAEEGKCICCGKTSKQRVVFSKSY